MRLLLTILTLIALTGCGNETRTSWEKAFPWTVESSIEYPSTSQTTTVVYLDAKPVFDLAGNTHTYKTVDGMHINVYDLEGNLISHKWQNSVPLVGVK